MRMIVIVNVILSKIVSNSVMTLLVIINVIINHYLCRH